MRRWNGCPEPTGRSNPFGSRCGLSPAAPPGLVSDYLSVRFEDPRASQIDVLVQSDGVASGSLPPTQKSTTPAGIDP